MAILQKLVAAAALAACLVYAQATSKHIVLLAADDEYRSEEALPQLAKILKQRHGFRCTVLFAIDPTDGTIRPDRVDNIPGLEELETADLLVLFARFRDLPDSQMKHLARYIESGKPIVALRTATHSFNIKTSSTYAKYSWNNKEWDGGFGRQVLGETWISHHGKHGVQSTRALIAPGEESHPILRGIRSGEIWGPTDVYTVRQPFPADNHTLLLGQVLSGMRPIDPPVDGKQNDPMMPVAWTRMYHGGRMFTTTMGAAEDLENEALRRLIVNACYWGLELNVPPKADVALVGEYHPTHFGFGSFVKGRTPSDYR